MLGGVVLIAVMVQLIFLRPKSATVGAEKGAC
jgi:hypothetical protein